MKQLSRIAAAATLAVGALAAGQAVAGPVCTNCVYTGDTYLGQHNPTTGEGADYRRPVTNSSAASFTDVWVFDISPSGGFQLNGSWQTTPNSFTRFEVKLFSLIGSPTCGAVGTSCSGVSFNSLAPINQATFPLGLSTGLYTMPNITLNAGWYAFVVSGDVTGLRPTSTNYSGQVATNAVPEPGSLALVGLALLGAAAGMRRSRKA